MQQITSSCAGGSQPYLGEYLCRNPKEQTHGKGMGSFQVQNLFMN